MQILMNEVLSDESKFCYMKIKEEIKQLEIICEEKQAKEAVPTRKAVHSKKKLTLPHV